VKFLGDPKLFPLAELKPHPAFQMLAAYSKERETGITAVMRKIGFDPSEPLIIGVFGEERYVVGGYQRWGAAKAAGREEIWIQEIEFESFDEAIAYEKTRSELRRKGEDGDILFALCVRHESLQQHGGKRRGEEADKIKIDFVHHVSYELRSPLTNIIGFAHFLGDPVTGPLTEKQREYLSYITVSTNALLAIINNILDLATIDAGAMTLNLGAVDIRRTMEAAAEGVQDRLVKNGIRLEIRTAPDIGSFVADERRVRQSLFNLLANAVGFSPAGETVTFAAQRLKDAVVFSVTDRGPGIPANVQDKVFDWFETHSLGSRHRGTGLGLSLVRSFVELHGGTVTLESAVGRGTTVTCIFPLDHRAERTAA